MLEKVPLSGEAIERSRRGCFRHLPELQNSLSMDVSPRRRGQSVARNRHASVTAPLPQTFFLPSGSSVPQLRRGASRRRYKVPLAACAHHWRPRSPLFAIKYAREGTEVRPGSVPNWQGPAGASLFASKTDAPCTFQSQCTHAIAKSPIQQLRSPGTTNQSRTGRA